MDGLRFIIVRLMAQECAGIDGLSDALGLLAIGWSKCLETRKLGRHRWIPPGQFFDRHILGLVICKAQVPIGAEQCIFRLLQVVDGFVDLISGSCWLEHQGPAWADSCRDGSAGCS